jgi:hypothetical protein
VDKAVAALVKELKAGYRIEPLPRRADALGGYYYVVSPEGVRALQPDGRPIVLHKADSPKSLSRLRGQLIKAGAIVPRVKNRTVTLTPASAEVAKLPHTQAVEVLRSSESSARERALAREVIRLHDDLESAQNEIVRLRAFGKAAVERLLTPTP